MILVSLFQKVVKSNHEEQFVQDFVMACFDEYYNKIYSYALGKTKCQATAADIAQDTFFKFQEALIKRSTMKFEEEEDVLCYLTTMARNLAYSRFRKASRYVQLEENWDSGKKHNPYPVIDLQQDLATQLKQLSSKQAEMLELRKAGYSYQEIADTMGMKREAVRKSLYRCREKLKLLKSD